MTTEQLEHLRLIDAHLTNLLKTAGKRTPGEWRTDEGVSYFGLKEILGRPDSEAIQMPCPPFALGKCGAVTVGDNYKHDAAFIASCAGNAEAGWRSTKETIKWALFMHENGQVGEGLLDSILAAWPLELITKHQ